MYVPLDRDSPRLLSRQISSYLAELIRHGHLGPGARLPTTRSLAKSLGVSKNTVEAAYEELVSRRLVTTRPGRSVTVRRRIPEDTELNLPLVEPRGRDPLPARAWLATDPQDEHEHDFAGAGPRLTNFSARQLKLFHEGALVTSRGPLFAPPPPLGESSLRQAACRHFARCGVLRTADEVAIVRDRREAVRAVLRLFVPPRGTVLAASLLDPDLALPLRDRRARIAVLPPHEDAAALLAAVRRGTPRLLVVATGSSRLPGAAPSLARRRALLDLARTKGIPVLEDVTPTGTEPTGEMPPPLAVLDPSGRVLALCDLSDEVGGEFSAAALAAGPKALDRLRVLGGGQPAPDRLAQRALAQALESSGRTRTLRHVHENRRLLTDPIAATVRRRLPDLPGWSFAPGRDAIRLDLPADLTGRAVREAALDRGIHVFAAEDCGARAEDDRFLLLDLTRQDEGDLLDGIRKLAEVVHGLAPEGTP